MSSDAGCQGEQLLSVGKRLRWARRPFGALSAAIFLVLAVPSASAHLDLVSPSGPTTLVSHQVIEIAWDVYISHGPGTIKVEFSTDNGASYVLIQDSIPYSGSADRFGSILWSVPEVDTTEGRIKVTYDAGGGGIYYNGLFPSENDPLLTIQNLPSAEIVLQEDVGGYAGTRDTTIYEGFDTFDDFEDNSNGGGQNLFAGSTNVGYSRRALIEFDLSEIPAGSVILAASLELVVTKTVALSTTQSLHRLLMDWGEGTNDTPDPEGRGLDADPGDATWVSDFHTVSVWTNPGAEGDYEPTASASATVDNVASHPVWEGPGLARDVQDWLTGDAPNHGWILIGDETTNRTAKEYSSSEDSTVPLPQGPRLTVRYLLSTDVARGNWTSYD